MATITATKSGNWSDTTVWDLGRAPVDGDLVQAVSYVIDFDVDINQPSTVLNATSGYFYYNGGATRNVTANANLGTHSTAGLIRNSAVGTLNFYGIVVGGSGIGAYGVFNSAAGTITVTTATGGSGSGAYGAVNNAAGTMTVDLAVGNDYGPGGTHPYSAPGVSANNTVGQITRVKRVRFGAHGQSPIVGAVQMVVDASNEGVFVTNYSGGTRTLTPSGASAQFPATSDVRSGVSYDNGDKIGACAVPAASNVAVGIAVGNTTGTAVLTVDGVRTAVGLASANLDTQISAVKAAIVSPAIVL